VTPTEIHSVNQLFAPTRRGTKSDKARSGRPVEGEVRLGMMMKPLKGAISREIGKVLDQYLGAH